MKYGLGLFTALLFTAPMFVVEPAAAEVYRCQGTDGVQFSDASCGDNAETVTIRDNRIGGSFNQNLPAPATTAPAAATPTPQPPPQAAEPEAPDSVCRFISSTDLRTYITREQVVKGMTQDNVLDAFGRPPETYPVPQETWVYHTDYYGRLYELTYVYFRDGCVERVEYRKP